jgi:aryl-alcohol dehydrogenase-like predicted oxidoreductase
MNFGPLTTQTDSFVIMDRALEHGINFFDTANRYGGDKGPGATETIVGKWFAQGGERREKVVLATKVFGPMTPWPNDGGLSARHIRDACDASLRRLQTDHIDLYQMHHVDRAAPWDEIWQAMETLVEQGKVIYTGSSNFAGWHIAQANEAAAHRHFLGLVSEQSLYNLMSRTIELEVLPACRGYGLGVIRGARSPVAARRPGGPTPPPQERAAPLRASACSSSAGKRSAKSSVRSRLRSRWRGCCTRRGDRADRRAAHARAARRRVAARDRDRARRSRTEGARRHLPRSRRHRARGVCLVSEANDEVPA